jgi:hypothetical protein
MPLHSLEVQPLGLYSVPVHLDSEVVLDTNSSSRSAKYTGRKTIAETMFVLGSVTSPLSPKGALLAEHGAFAVVRSSARDSASRTDPNSRNPSPLPVGL